MELNFLAEKIGLIPCDDSKKQLDESEWTQIKDKYNQREDYKHLL